MGNLVGGLSEIVEAEQTSWAKSHDLCYNFTKRDEQLELLGNFNTGPKAMKTCSEYSSMFGVKYEHWYITDGRWVFEFGGGEIHDAIIEVHNNEKNAAKQVIREKFTLDYERLERMRKLCGATNYSLALRNCEHVARYIHSGCWISMQMLEGGILRNEFRKYMGKHAKMINLLPKELKTETARLSILYPDIQNKITFERYVECLTTADNQAYNVAVFGPTGAGKSNLINNMCNQEVCPTGATAESVTRSVNFIQGKAKIETWDFSKQEIIATMKKINIIDTIGFCDSLLSASDVLEVIKHSVKANLGYIDKVVIVCAGRIEKTHADSIKQFMKWLRFKDYKRKFVFIYNKSDTLDEATKLSNLAYMMNVLEADPNSHLIWVPDGTRIEFNLALGFPENSEYEDIQEDHTKLKRAVLVPYPEERIPVPVDSSCNIL